MKVFKSFLTALLLLPVLGASGETPADSPAELKFNNAAWINSQVSSNNFSLVANTATPVKKLKIEAEASIAQGGGSLKISGDAQKFKYGPEFELETRLKLSATSVDLTGKTLSLDIYIPEDSKINKEKPLSIILATGEGDAGKQIQSKSLDLVKGKWTTITFKPVGAEDTDYVSGPPESGYTAKGDLIPKNIKLFLKTITELRIRLRAPAADTPVVFYVDNLVWK